MFDVKFNDYSAVNDFGLIYNTKTISEPEPQINRVAVPGRNGGIDVSEVNGGIKYNDREISITFTIKNPFVEWELARTKIANALHGQQVKIVFDDDLNYYWLGRVQVGDVEPEGSTATITMAAVVDPYKYNITTSAEDWLWDPFDFEQSVINETFDMHLKKGDSFTIYPDKKLVVPIVTCNKIVEVNYSVHVPDKATVRGVTYFMTGTHTMYDLKEYMGICDEISFTVMDDCIVTMEYRGGRL